MTDQLKVLLIDSFPTGHHPSYLRIFSEAFLDLGCQVFAAGPLEGKIHESLSANTRYHFVSCDLPERHKTAFRSYNSFMNAFTLWKQTHNVIQKIKALHQTKPDFVFFPYVDALLGSFLAPFFLNRWFPCPWAGLLVQSWFLRRPPKKEAKKSWRRKVLNAFFPSNLKTILLDCYNSLNKPHRLLRGYNCFALMTLEEDICRFLGKACRIPVYHCPDFIDSSQPDSDYPLVQRFRKWKGNRTCVISIGSQSERKGLFDLIHCARDMEKDHPDICFAFIGALQGGNATLQEHSLLRTPPRNCFVHFDRLPRESVFNALIMAGDILYAAYRGFLQSSNILTKAAHLEKPILVSNVGLMGARVRTYRFGKCVPEGDRKAIKKALIEMVRERESEKVESKQGWSKYRKLHSLETMYRELEKLVSHAPKA